jgi:hypothetical protein
VRDALDGVVLRLRPTSVEEVATMLELDVFDLPNLQSRVDESRAAAERKAQEVELKAAVLLRRMALDVELEAAVVAAVDAFEAELLAAVGKIATQLKPLHALEGGAVGALLVKEVKARVERALYVL